MDFQSGRGDRENGRLLCLGFDAGSVALKTVVTDPAGRILDATYTRTNGQPLATARRVLGALLDRFPESCFSLIAGTGSAGVLIGKLLDAAFFNEVICQAVAGRYLVPGARMALEIGGQDSKLIVLPPPGGNGQDMVDFAMNTSCAAGTGSFLDQQASRLGVRIEEEFGRLALASRLPARVAGRCSVFAKSDMIHLQQQATPTEDIVAGLCLGLARNLKSNLGQGYDWKGPIVFCGGVAANEGVVRAIREVLGLGAGDVIVPEEHAVSGALGAVLAARRQQAEGRFESPRLAGGRLNIERLDHSLNQGNGGAHRLSPLDPPDEAPRIAEPSGGTARGNREPIDGYLGLDVGSISTKAAVIDAQNGLLAKNYQMTAGRPLDAVRRVLAEIRDQLDPRVRIRGAATTGSGRYLTGDFIGADLVINEITAQAAAAGEADPDVDTVFEIGGQDSKYIRLDRGVVVDFEMNHACAAGTGSFLEEQAERLGIRIQEEFGRIALGSRQPVRLGERCTVFMESDLLSHQQRGESVEDLVAGLCYSIVGNYLSRVVGNRRIGRRIYFQGATAFNQGVVAAFRKLTGLDVRVPANPEVTGAIGAAVLVRRAQQQPGRGESRFAGFALADLQCRVRSFACDACSNHCEVNEVTIPGRSPLYHGSRCDRYNVKKGESAASARRIPDLFAERQQLLLRHAHLPEPRPDRPTVGIPLALSNYELLPFWGTLLGQLGANVTVSPVSNRKIIRRGVEVVLSTPCFPVKVAHGHVLELIELGVDYLWMPSVISMWRDHPGQRFNQLCPYVTAFPYQIAAAVDPERRGVGLLRPPVSFEEGRSALIRQLRPVAERLGASRRQLRLAVRRAWEAQEEFERACRARGRAVLDALGPEERAMVVVSRPYNGCDSGLHLDLPGKLRRLGVLAMPVDFLEVGSSPPPDDQVFEAMYWKYGQRILRAAGVIRSDPRLHAIFLSNFGCGPDSFLQEYFHRLMAPKPSLVLEIDEHSAGAGLVTRLEAFLESLRGVQAAELPQPRRLHPPRQAAFDGRTVFVPWMGDQCHGLAAALRASGQAAEVMPTGDPADLELGRRACGGKQCLPCLITAGDMIRTVRRPGFDPHRAAFLMPSGSGPCRFGQYHCLHRVVLDELGMQDVPLFSPSHDSEFYDHCRQLGRGALMQAWYSNCACDLLERAVAAVRPYETRPGNTDEVYRRCLDRLLKLVETRPALPQLAQELRRAAVEFQAVPTDRTRQRPKIGIVGETFVRFHRFANNDLVHLLERLGAETVGTGFPEWMYYTNWTRRVRAGTERHVRHWLTAWITDRLMRRSHRRLAASFAPLLGPFAEPHPKELFSLAAPYLDPSFEGEAILTVGRTLDLCRQGCHGVINVMPFSCMPSTIVAGLIKRSQAGLGRMPTLTISFDGQEDPAMETRLEAFLHQARAAGAGDTAAKAFRPARPEMQGTCATDRPMLSR